MSFESTAEGRVGVDGADWQRKTVPHVGNADRESPSSELGPSSLYRGCSGRSGAGEATAENVLRSPRLSVVVLFSSSVRTSARDRRQNVSESCRRMLMNFFQEWDVWLAPTGDWIPAIIPIATRIPELRPLRDMDNFCTSFAD